MFFSPIYAYTNTVIKQGFWVYPQNEKDPFQWGYPLKNPNGSVVDKPGTPNGDRPVKLLFATPDKSDPSKLNWDISMSPGIQSYGNIDWVGKKRTILIPMEPPNPPVQSTYYTRLSYWGPPSRYFPSPHFNYDDNEDLHSEIYKDGVVIAVAPKPVLGAAICIFEVALYNGTDSETTKDRAYIVAACKDGLDDVFYAQPFGQYAATTAALDKDPALRDKMKRMKSIDFPDGWLVIGKFPAQKDNNEIALAARTPWFFNMDGNEAQCMREMDATFNNGKDNVTEPGLNRYRATMPAKLPGSVTFTNERNEPDAYQYTETFLKKAMPHLYTNNADHYGLELEYTLNDPNGDPRDPNNFARDSNGFPVPRDPERHVWAVDKVEQSITLQGKYIVAVDYAAGTNNAVFMYLESDIRRNEYRWIYFGCDQQMHDFDWGGDNPEKEYFPNDWEPDPDADAGYYESAFLKTPQWTKNPEAGKPAIPITIPDYQGESARNWLSQFDYMFLSWKLPTDTKPRKRVLHVSSSYGVDIDLVEQISPTQSGNSQASGSLKAIQSVTRWIHFIDIRFDRELCVFFQTEKEYMLKPYEQFLFEHWERERECYDTDGKWGTPITSYDYFHRTVEMSGISERPSSYYDRAIPEGYNHDNPLMSVGIIGWKIQDIYELGQDASGPNKGIDPDAGTEPYNKIIGWDESGNKKDYPRKDISWTYSVKTYNAWRKHNTIDPKPKLYIDDFFMREKYEQPEDIEGPLYNERLEHPFWPWPSRIDLLITRKLWPSGLVLKKPPMGSWCIDGDGRILMSYQYVMPKEPKEPGPPDPDVKDGKVINATVPEDTIKYLNYLDEGLDSNGDAKMGPEISAVCNGGEFFYPAGVS